jgi:hypothetical protein
MTDLSPREILEAIRRGLEETARRFANGKSDQPLPPAKDGADRAAQDRSKM